MKMSGEGVYESRARLSQGSMAYSSSKPSMDRGKSYSTVKLEQLEHAGQGGNKLRNRGYSLSKLKAV